MKPLGYKTYRGLGFGGTIFTYRNCPNNTPLVFGGAIQIWKIGTVKQMVSIDDEKNILKCLI